jgi:radical SAM protein with 4Fe4S-binding SPASM domain
VFWESTIRCNLACVHCRRVDDEQTVSLDLKTHEVRAMLESIATLGRPIFVFSGGEPLMRPDWRELADHARSLEIPTALATNGTLIDAGVARQIASAGFRRVSISLDGADAATHDLFRGLPGAFDEAVAGIGRLREAGVPFQINATIAAHNDGQLDRLYELARDLGAEALHLFLLVPVGCGAQIGPTHQLDARRYEHVLEWVCDRWAGGAGLELKATCAPHFYRLASQRGLDVGHGRGCLCGVSVLFVSHSGEVFPCGYLPVRCGSVRETPLADIWRDSEVFAELRDFDKLKGKCGRCEYRRVCGGCRARAYAATGDYLGPEPTCTHLPGA